MDIYKISMTEPAKHDLREIAIYIASQLKAPETAIKMVKTIQENIAKLETNAFLHPLVNDERLSILGYRSLIIKNYIAFYIANETEKTVVVDRILYFRRNWQALL
ncbi:MAG: type II toxin-antitoxin system RelE/ParE family toxin [Clostridiales bacterium]|jgi:addiction module RelE/StbE family toxin|nr:type II toxin-antitoxin system RelE/ParE family toxin [Clostridiales bacterium]